MQYFVENLSSLDQKKVCIEGDENHHLVRVKRISVGDKIKFFNGKGWKGEGEVLEASKQRSTLKVLSLVAEKKVSNPITLFIATPKGKAFSFLIEKAVEAGVNCIVPIVSERSEKSFVDRKADKLEKVVLEACKQCEQSHLPEIQAPIEFKASLEFLKNTDLRLLFHTNGGVSPVDTIRQTADGQAVGMWVGSEGGWSQNEILLAQEFGLTICTLPMPIMRVETAVIVAIGLVRVLIDKGLWKIL